MSALEYCSRGWFCMQKVLGTSSPFPIVDDVILLHGINYLH